MPTLGGETRNRLQWGLCWPCGPAWRSCPGQQSSEEGPDRVGWLPRPAHDNRLHAAAVPGAVAIAMPLLWQVLGGDGEAAEILLADHLQEHAQ